MEEKKTLDNLETLGSVQPTNGGGVDDNNGIVAEGNLTEVTEVAVEPERVSFTAEEWEAELSQAEERGYLRGRNEQVELLMAEPLPYESLDPDFRGAEEFLRHIRPSVWGL